ncbi:ketosteroid isomerase-like protein [Bradyrhizobium sp. S3.2.12]
MQAPSMPVLERAVTSPKDIVLNAWKTFSSRDAGRIAALFTDDAEWIAPKGNATAVALDHTDHMMGARASSRRRCTGCFPRSISPFAASTPTAMS